MTIIADVAGIGCGVLHVANAANVRRWLKRVIDVIAAAIYVSVYKHGEGVVYQDEHA